MVAAKLIDDMDGPGTVNNCLIQAGSDIKRKVTPVSKTKQYHG